MFQFTQDCMIGVEQIDEGDIDKNPQEYLESLIEFLLGWLINHILYTDKKIPKS